MRVFFDAGHGGADSGVMAELDADAASMVSPRNDVARPMVLGGGAPAAMAMGSVGGRQVTAERLSGAVLRASDVNLEAVLRMMQVLQTVRCSSTTMAGEPHAARTGDVFVPLESRVASARSSGASVVVVVRCGHVELDVERARGPRVAALRGCPGSVELAGKISRRLELVDDVPQLGTAPALQAYAAAGIPRPVLVSPGFLSNRQDVVAILQGEVLDRIAKAVCAALADMPPAPQPRRGRRG